MSCCHLWWLMLCAVARARAGQYNDASWNVVQLRKIVQDARAKSSGGAQQNHFYHPHKHQEDPEVQQLAEACAGCERELEEVSTVNQ